MTAMDIRRAYRIAGRTCEFRSPRPTQGGPSLGCAVWWPAPPAASELTAEDWTRYKACRADFLALLQEHAAPGVIVLAPEAAGIQ